MKDFHKKESPFQGITGLAGGATGLRMAGVASKTYVDELFSTYLYTGNGSSISVANGIDNSDKGGMVWTKSRGSGNHVITDTVRGAGKGLLANSNGASSNNLQELASFNSDGFSLGSNYQVNDNGVNHASWNWAIKEGFFDVVQYTGNGSAGHQVAHSLGCEVGFMMVKRLENSANWSCYHRDAQTSGAYYFVLNDTGGAGQVTDIWNDTAPTSTHFTLGTSSNTNGNGETYVCYLFAGGESTADTATSVKTESSGYLGLAQSTDFDLGTSDFTIEAWAKPLAGSTTGNNFYVLSMGYPFLLYYMADGSVPYSGKFVYEGSSTNASMDYMVSGNTGANSVAQNQWHHVAVTRSGNTFRFFLNGELKHTSTSSGTFGTNTVHGLQIGRAGPVGTDYFQGQVSNFRYVLGTAVYTSAFRPPTEPLSNVTNTKVLCCQGSATDSATVSPGTITPYNSPSWSAESPFDDPAGFVFGGDSDQGIIKCGSYVGNSSATGPEVYLGWEPQFIIVKETSASGNNWRLWDSMRGIMSNGIDETLYPSSASAEYGTVDKLDLTSTGFKLTRSDSAYNGDGSTYVYIAIRRPDGYVGKPPEAGTEVFALDTGAGNSVVPNFDSTFPVDYWLMRKPAASQNWYTGTRLISDEGYTNSNVGWGTQSGRDTDSNVGWGNNSWMNSDYQSWMWKRGQGMDVVSYTGDGVDGRTINHSMNQAPEMIWIKNRTTSGNTGDWMVGHKDLNAGSSPWNYYLVLNKMQAEYSDSNPFNNSAPTATSFELDSWDRVNANGSNYAALLFSSVTGISKVGSYTGTDSNPGPTITTGFQPRFIMIKARNQSGNWVVLDSLRTFDNYSWLNLTNAQENTLDILDVSSTGFTIKAAYTDTNVYQYIYYAHA